LLALHCGASRSLALCKNVETKPNNNKNHANQRCFDRALMMETDETEIGGQEAAPLDMLSALFEARGWDTERESDEEALSMNSYGWDILICGPITACCFIVTG
jgi:hypothetical protein